MLLIGVAVLIFFGPSKLPELGKSLGRGIQEFKKASRELTAPADDAK
jgi:sec-independent protein translocase protein TatA